MSEHEIVSVVHLCSRAFHLPLSLQTTFAIVLKHVKEFAFDLGDDVMPFFSPPRALSSHSVTHNPAPVMVSRLEFGTSGASVSQRSSLEKITSKVDYG